MDYQKELILFLEHFAPNQSQDVRDAVELDASFHVINVPKLLAVKGLSENYVFRLKDSWNAWKAAKAQAVPETQQALNDRLLVKSIREHVESHIAEVSVNDLFDKGWLAAMKCIQNNIDMLEAQEPAND